MNLFLQLLGNGIVQGAVAMLYAAGFGFVYRSFRVFHIAMGAQFVFSCYAFYLCAVVLKLPLAAAVPGALALSVLFALAMATSRRVLFANRAFRRFAGNHGLSN